VGAGSGGAPRGSAAGTPADSGAPDGRTRNAGVKRPGAWTSAAPRARRARAAGPIAAQALFEWLDRGEFPASLYLDGPSEALKAALLAELRHAWARTVPGAQPARVFRAAESGVDEILAAYQGISLFSPRDLIIVLEVEDLGRSEKRIAALAAGIAEPAGESCLVLAESQGDNPRKSLDPLRAACAARWSAVPPRRQELVLWCARRLARGGVTADPGVVDSVIEACEGDPLASFNEIDRLMSYGAPSARLTATEVAALLRPVAGAVLTDYLGAVALGQGRLAAQRLGRLLAAGAEEGAVLWALSNLVGGALGGWAKQRELSFTLGRRLGPPALGRAMDAVYRAEAAWKGGRADPVAVLEQVTRALCTPGAS
jgi:DNA polymerase III delta subunit